MRIEEPDASFENRDVNYPLRLRPSERELFRRAAKAAGAPSMARWMRAVLIADARRRLQPSDSTT